MLYDYGRGKHMENAALDLWREVMELNEGPYTTLPYVDDYECFYCRAGYADDHKPGCIFMRAKRLIAQAE